MDVKQTVYVFMYISHVHMLGFDFLFFATLYMFHVAVQLSCLAKPARFQETVELGPEFFHTNFERGRSNRSKHNAAFFWN